MGRHTNKKYRQRLIEAARRGPEEFNKALMLERERLRAKLFETYRNLVAVAAPEEK